MVKISFNFVNFCKFLELSPKRNRPKEKNEWPIIMVGKSGFMG